MKRNLYYCLLIVAAMFASCTKITEQPDGEDNDGKTALTRSMNAGASDPYKLAVMQRALDEYLAENPDMADKVKNATLYPTDYYVRFLPQDSVQMDIADALGIDFFYHRLDVMAEMNPDGAIVEPEMNGDYPVMYAVVPTDFVFPEGLPYELIYGVCIQRDKGVPENQLSDEVYDNVFRKALILSGYASKTRGIEMIPEWEPSVKIRFPLGGKIVPLAGAKICVRFVTSYSETYALTDINGETGPMGRYTTPVEYEIIWNDNRWNIRSGHTNTTRISDFGYGYTEPLDVTFEDNTINTSLCGVHRALHAYFYEDVPLTAGLVKYKTIKVGVFDEYHPDEGGNFNHARRSQIYIFAKNKDNMPRDAKDIMGIVLHELGHGSHYKLEPGDYNKRGGNPDGQSWAEGVSYAYMKSFFPDYTLPNSKHPDIYTKLVECLMINGIGLGDIQNALKKSDGWASWCAEIKKKNIIDPDYVDLIFNHPNELTFDMNKILNVGFPKIFLDQPVWFTLPEKCPASFGIETFEIIDGSGKIMQRDSRRIAVSFNTPGVKRVKAVISMDGILKIYEQQVEVRNVNIIKAPIGELKTYKPITFSLQDIQFLDPNLSIIEWTTTPDAECIVDGGLSTTYKFTTPGEKIIHFHARYHHNIDEPNPIYIDVIHETKVVIEALPDAESFEIVDPPAYFEYGVTYTAKFLNDSVPVFISDIQLPHNKYYMWINFQSWSQANGARFFTFSLPVKYKDVPIDYNMQIYYKTSQYSGETKIAVLKISNIR